MTSDKDSIYIKKSQEIKIPLNPPFPKGELKVALVHDFLVQYGGAEKVLESLCEMFPEAPIYTLLYDKKKMRGKFKNKEIHTSFLQKFPAFLKNRRRYLLPFMPTAPETFDLRDYDLVVSSSGAWSKGIITKLNTIHIAYIHSPMRFAWDYNGKYVNEIGKKGIHFFIRAMLNYIRVWDRQAADRPDYLIANSEYTRERIKKYYRRNSRVIYPPVSSVILSEVKQSEESRVNNTSYKLQATSYFLIVSRLSAYKKVDLAVEAFNKLGFPLIVIGEGEQEKYLRKIAGKNIKILGWQNDETLAKYYAGARAFIFPSEDDFGITMVEAMNHGVPVIAFRKGGAKEIIQDGINGEFFNAQTPEVLADGVRRFMENEKKYNSEIIKKSAEKFSEKRFKDSFMEVVRSVISN